MLISIPASLRLRQSLDDEPSAESMHPPMGFPSTRIYPRFQGQEVWGSSRPASPPRIFSSGKNSDGGTHSEFAAVRAW
jgi:hypothetical protein